MLLRLIAVVLLMIGLGIVFIIGIAAFVVFAVFIENVAEMAINKINRFFDGGNDDQN